MSDAKKTRVTDYLPDPANPNLHTERGVRMLDDSLSKVGLGRSIVVDKNNYVLAGNSTQERAVDQGFQDAIEVESDGNQLIVVKRTDLDLLNGDDKARMLSYFDNRTSEVSLEWDAEQLLADSQSGVPVEELFRDDEWAELLAGIEQPAPPEDPGAQVDRADELQQKWKVQRGQIWVIPSQTADGCHRVMCGDSTDEGDVARLMDGEKADAVVTDPPYGVKRDKGFGGFGGFGPPIARKQYKGDWDSERPKKQAFDLMLKQAPVAIIFGGNFFSDLLPVGNHWVVWDKLNTMPTFGDCELIWTNVSRKSVKKMPFEYNGLLGKEVGRWHATQKPVGLLVKLIEEYTESGNAVFDPFLGSGTTLVACEQTGRLGRGIEIHPPYVAVTLQRLKDLGLEPKLSGEEL